MKKLQRQKGFTLVELAIVLTIIGLLIGGILKGQQLIDNARITSQLAQFQGLEAAYTTFNDTYAAVPGDMANALTRLQNCTAANSCANGNGDGTVGTAGTVTAIGAAWGVGGIAGENVQFWTHLSDAGLISGIATPPVAPFTFGNNLPKAKAGTGGLIVANLTGANYSGLYTVLLQSTANPGAVAGQQPLTPSEAAQIDRKMDDGNPASGNVEGYGVAAECVNGPTYQENVASKDCGVFVRMQ